MDNFFDIIRTVRLKMIACIADAIANSGGTVILPHDTELSYYKDNGDKTASDKTIVVLTMPAPDSTTFTFTDEDGDIGGPEKLSVEDLEFITSKLCK